MIAPSGEHQVPIIGGGVGGRGTSGTLMGAVWGGGKNLIMIAPSGEHRVPTMGVWVGDKKLHLTGFIFVHHQGSTGYPPCGGVVGVITSFNQIYDCTIRGALGTHHGGGRGGG